MFYEFINCIGTSLSKLNYVSDKIDAEHLRGKCLIVTGNKTNILVFLSNFQWKWKWKRL